MKAGVFPLNSSSINSSRVLRTASAFTSSSHIPANRSNDNLIHNSSTSDGSGVISNNILNNATASSIASTNAIQADASSGVPSYAAVPLLNQVLQETMISDDYGDDDDDEEDDKDYSPPRSISTSSIPTKSASTNDNQEKISSRRNNKRKSVTWDLTSFDDTDEDGKLSNHNAMSVRSIFLVDDEILNYSPRKSSRSQSKQLSPANSNQSIASRQRKKQKQVSLVVDVSNEKGNHTKSIASVHKIFIGNPVRSSSIVQSQKSLDAINDTLKTIFASPSEPSSKKPTKRKVLKRPNGQIMTEQDVIQQLEEQKENNQKRSQSSSNKSIQSKQQQTLKQTGMKKLFLMADECALRVIQEV